MAEVLKFPGSGGPPKKAIALKFRPPPIFQTFEKGQATELHSLTIHVLERGNQLIEFIDANRMLAREAGIETIGVEIAAILEGEKILQIQDAIENALRKDRPVKITEEGTHKLRRAEALLAEAASNITKYTDVKDEVSPSSPALGQPTSDGASSLSPLWGIVVLVGAGLAVWGLTLAFPEDDPV